ncbi:MAG TPA: hypothetical protein VFH29_00820 [Anaerolineales bacterium]|nr:hypothetical protein [Anaerolineales bacterium]
MNHQPFENWLLDEAPLTTQQQRDLQNHLRGCTTCSGIADANLALHSTHLAAPMPGFTDRFRPRLTAWRREQQRRQAIGTILLVCIGVGLLYALAGPAMLEAVRSPGAWLGEVTAYAVEMLTLFAIIGHVGGILLRLLPGALPTATWPSTVLAGGMLVGVWIILMRKLARAPQGVGK